MPTSNIKVNEAIKWRFFISWDNPIPPNSKEILRALKRLGHVSHLATKTSVALAPKKGKGYRDVRIAIQRNLSRTKGNAFYVNLRSGRAFQISAICGMTWMSAP
jgi:pyridoxine/pyridoxamine 5'-phosphate oxidase